MRFLKFTKNRVDLESVDERERNEILYLLYSFIFPHLKGREKFQREIS